MKGERLWKVSSLRRKWHLVFLISHTERRWFQASNPGPHQQRDKRCSLSLYIQCSCRENFSLRPVVHEHLKAGFSGRPFLGKALRSGGARNFWFLINQVLQCIFWFSTLSSSSGIKLRTTGLKKSRVIAAFLFSAVSWMPCSSHAPCTPHVPFVYSQPLHNSPPH